MRRKSLSSVPFFASILAATLAFPAAAREVFECSFPEVGNNMGYLPQTVVIARNDDNETVTLADAYIQSVKGGPITVKIAEENTAKLSVSWPLMLQGATNQYVKMQYRIAIQKGSLSARLTGLPQGFANNFSAQGKCKRLEG